MKSRFQRQNSNNEGTQSPSYKKKKIYYRTSKKLFDSNHNETENKEKKLNKNKCKVAQNDTWNIEEKTINNILNNNFPDFCFKTKDKTVETEWMVLDCPICHSKKNNVNTLNNKKPLFLDKEEDEISDNNTFQLTGDLSSESFVVHKKNKHFLCFNCGFHGDLKVEPKLNSLSWLDIWQEFIKDPIWRESVLNLDTPYVSYYQKEANNGRAIIIPYWNDKNEKWRIGTYWVCENQHNKILDAFIQDYSNKKWYRPKFTTPYPFYETHIEKQNEQKKVIFVNHMEDYFSLKLSDYEHVVCFPPDIDPYIISNQSHSPWNVMQNMESIIHEKDEIVFSFRSDRKSRALEKEMGRRMDRERCYRTRWFVDNDDVEEKDGASYIYQHFDESTLKIIVNSSTPFPVIGIYELQDVEKELEELYETGLVPGSCTGWPTLDQFYTVKPGQWTVITGIPGHGKSQILDNLLVQLANINGWRFGLFSPETQPISRHFASLMEKKVKKPFSKGPTPRISIEEKNKAKHWLNEHFKIILPDEENGVWTVDAVLKLTKQLVYRHGIRGVVIDPWNEIDHSNMGNKRETDHISESLTKIRRFARLYDIHVWIVAHPTKLSKKEDGKYPVATPYDISGGAHWRNKADNALCVYRNVGEEDEDVCDIHIQKIRFHEIGKIGIASLRCDRTTKTYIDDIDQDKRHYALMKGKYLPSNNIRIPHPREYTKANNEDEEMDDFDFS